MVMYLETCQFESMTKMFEQVNAESYIFTSPPPRKELLNRLKTEVFDVLVVGGGSTGTMTALDASTRGLKVALIEQLDYGSGTSSRSTNLLHGGVRYLENAVKTLDFRELKLVLEALHERSTLLQMAPYMSHPLPTLIPSSSLFRLGYVACGLFLYDLLAGFKSKFPKFRFISKSEIRYLFPNLKDSAIKAGVVYFDGQTNDSRLNSMINMTCIQNGVVSVNYVKATNILKNSSGMVTGVVAQTNGGSSTESFTIQCKALINACGPFADSLRKLDQCSDGATATASATVAPGAVDDSHNHLAEQKSSFKEVMVPASGAHVIVDSSFCNNCMGIVSTSSDGRVVFVLPWKDQTIMGTTDRPTELSLFPKPDISDVDFILHEVNKLLKTTLTHGDVQSVWQGIRPLVKDVKAKSTSSTSRSHWIEVSESNMITIAGGKWTTVRNMAEETVDTLVKSVLGWDTGTFSCKTSQLRLVGACESIHQNEACEKDTESCFLQDRMKITHELIHFFNIPSKVASHLAESYGYRAFQIASSLDGSEKELLHPFFPVLRKEVEYLIQNECAVHLSDVIVRRLRLCAINAKKSLEAVPVTMEIMKNVLQWTEQQIQEEWSDTLMQIDLYTLKY